VIARVASSAPGAVTGSTTGRDASVAACCTPVSCASALAAPGALTASAGGRIVAAASATRRSATGRRTGDLRLRGQRARAAGDGGRDAREHAVQARHRLRQRVDRGRRPASPSAGGTTGVRRPRRGARGRRVTARAAAVASAARASVRRVASARTARVASALAVASPPNARVTPPRPAP
jgi:hypothetical protein